MIDSGQLQALLGDRAEFLLAYYRHIAAGHAPDLVPQLPAFGRYAGQLRDYYAYLAGGGLPAGYTALDSDTLLLYQRPFIASGQLQALLGDRAEFLLAYYQYIAAGHAPDLFPRLPAFNGYEEALRAYYAYLMAGGKPSAYTALPLEQIRAYIDALERSGLLGPRFGGDIAVFLRDYHAWLAAGGNPDLFASLPQSPSTPPLTGKVQISTAMNMPGYVGKNYASSTASAETVSVDGNQVPNGLIPGGGGDFSIPAGATAHEVKNTDYIHVGRLTNATFVRHNGNYALGPNQGLHYGFVPELSNIPTSGVVNYKVAGATRPTWSSGALDPGYFEGRLAIAFGSSEYRVAIQGQVTMPGDANYTFSTPGGVAAVATKGTAQGNQYAFGWVPMDLVGTGRACSAGASCGLETNFQLGGNGGTGLTLTYLSWSDNAADDAFAGAVGFHKDSAATPPPAAASFKGATTTGLQGLYAGPLLPGVANLNGATLTLDASGVPVGATFGSAGHDKGAGTLTKSGLADGALAWWRWQGAGVHMGMLTSGKATDYMQYLVGAMPAHLPTTGVVTYGLVDGLAPEGVMSGGNFGTAVGNAAIAFGAAPKLGVEMQVKMPSGTAFNFATPGGIADPAASPITIASANGRFSGFGDWGTTNVSGACGDTGTACRVWLNGMLAGEGGSHVGLNYMIGANAGVGTVGTAIFKQGAPLVTIPALPSTTPPTTTDFSGTWPRMLGMQLTSGTPYFTAGTSPQGYSVAFNGDPWGIKSVTARGNNAVEAQGSSQVISSGWVAGDKAAWVTWAGGTSRPDRYTNWLLLPEMSGTLPTNATVHYGSVVGGMAPTMIKNGEYVTGTASGRAALQFGGGTYRLGMEMQVKMGTSVYDLATTGGVAAPSVNMILRGSTSGELASLTAADYMYTADNMGGLCTTTRCVANIMVQASGNQGSVLGANYNVWNHVDATNNFGGSAVFVKDATPAVNGAAVVAGASAITPMSVGSLGSMDMAGLRRPSSLRHLPTGSAGKPRPPASPPSRRSRRSPARRPCSPPMPQTPANGWSACSTAASASRYSADAGGAAAGMPSPLRLFRRALSGAREVR